MLIACVLDCAIKVRVVAVFGQTLKITLKATSHNIENDSQLLNTSNLSSISVKLSQLYNFVFTNVASLVQPSDEFELL